MSFKCCFGFCITQVCSQHNRCLSSRERRVQGTFPSRHNAPSMSRALHSRLMDTCHAGSLRRSFIHIIICLANVGYYLYGIMEYVMLSWDARGKQPTSSPAFLREFTILEAKSWSSCVKFAISGIEFTRKILACSWFPPYLKQEQKQ